MITLPTSIAMAYDDVGSGLPVVFLHGFPHDRSLWAAQLGAFADRARCIAPDLRGFGASTSAAPSSMMQYADDVAAASWDSVIFDLPGRDSLQRVPTLEPLRGTRNHVKELLDRCRTAEDLVRVLSGR